MMRALASGPFDGGIDMITRDRLRVQGVEPQIQSPDQFREKVKSEIERWGPVIDKSGIKGSL
jgi:tripartite-type tricarboxylate transporter receptor subunit TctC